MDAPAVCYGPAASAWAGDGCPAFYTVQKRVAFRQSRKDTVSRLQKNKGRILFPRAFFPVVLYGAQSLPRRAYECCTVCNAMRTRASERTNGDRRRGFMFISRRNAEKYSTVKAPSINYSGRNIRFPSNISCLVYIRRSAHCGV
jgi:hypothetical protein